MSAIPLYQRYRDSGARTHNRAGVSASLKPGDDPNAESVTWLVAAGSLAGLVPLAGDYMRGRDGAWWLVKGVGALTEGNYPLTCERWKAGEP